MRRSLLLILTFLTTDASAERIDRTAYVMGTELHVRVEAEDRAAALAASERALRAVEAAEERLSTWRSSTELMRLNRAAPDERTLLSRALAADLEAARWCWRATRGAFDPTVGALVRAWRLRAEGRRPSPEELRDALAATGMERLEVGAGFAVKRTGLWLEEGAFGKGAGLADALRALEHDHRIERAVLDFGGQLALLGEGTAWRFTLAHPRDRARPVVALEVEGGAVATTGNSERGRKVVAAGRSHILDPRTGEPVDDFGSLTVWTEDPLRADCLSTGLYVLGPEEALAWAAAHAGVEALLLLVSEEGTGKVVLARATPGFAGKIAPLDRDVRLEVVDRREVSEMLEEGSDVGP